MNATRLQVIGDENTVFGFALLGVNGQVVQSAEEADRALQRALDDPENAIVFLTDEWATAMRAKVDQHSATAAMPLLVAIPSGHTTVERQSLRELLQRALGIRLEG